MGNKIKVNIPDIGDFDSVPVIEVLVADGDQVAKDDPLIVLESDKATMEIPAPEAGVVANLQSKVDDKVAEGDWVCDLQQGDDDDANGEDASSDTDAEQPESSDPPDDDDAAEAKPKKDKQAAKADQADSESKPAAPSKGGKKSGGKTEVKVPDIGDYDSVPVIDVLVAEGDEVEAEQALVVLESDKATMDVPAPRAGIVRDLKVKVDDKLSAGDLVCSLEGADEDADADTGQAQAEDSGGKDKSDSKSSDEAQQQASAKEESKSGQREPEKKSGQADDKLPPHASPSVRKFARKLGVDLQQVRGSGPHARILKEDVEGFVSKALEQGARGGAGAGLPAQPSVDFSKFGPVEEKPLARIRKLSAQHLHKNWLLVPHVTQTDNADITELEAFRKQANGESKGPKLTLLPFVIKAVAQAMKAYPDFNSSLAADAETQILKGYCNIGFAADTPNGLVVPVIRDVWSKGIAELAVESAELAAKARDGKLKPDEMKGGCFSISSLGGIGGSHFSPIVNAPEVGILGVSRAAMQPVWDGHEFKPRLMCPLSLSYDHRVIDGAYAARFIVELVRLLSDIRRLSL